MKKYIYITIVALAVIGGIVWLIMTPAKPGKLDAFATCLKDKGSTFYGASWSSFSEDLKKSFGSSAKLLSYVECSNSNYIQNQVCIDKNINTFPTWEFADGSRLSGIGVSSTSISLEKLAEKTSCILPLVR